MFELGRGLKRILGTEHRRAECDLACGDTTAFERLDLKQLEAEAHDADVAAARMGESDKPRRRLGAAIAWREVARRTGDSVALRKASAQAEIAAAGYAAVRRDEDLARARCEQAFCMLLSAEIAGSIGLEGAAEIALRQARAQVRGGLVAALADTGLAVVEGRRGLEKGDADLARVAAEGFDAPIAALEAMARRLPAARGPAAEARLFRADLLSGWGARLQDRELLAAAALDAAAAMERLDQTYEPVSLARARLARGQALALLGESTGDIGPIRQGAEDIAATLDTLPRGHSPLDWARGHVALGQALLALGEACGDVRAFEGAVGCYDRAELVLRSQPALPLRALAAGGRATCLARNAEITGDLGVLDAAEVAMKAQLAILRPRRDPATWALAQLHLAHLYEARAAITGKDRGERAAALLALETAFEVFTDLGLRSLALQASDALERLRPPGEWETRRIE